MNELIINNLPNMSSIHFFADLVQDPLKYAKHKGYYPEILEKTIQRLSLCNIIAVANSLSSTAKNGFSLIQDINHLDYKSALISGIQIGSSVFDSIRYIEVFEKAVQHWLGLSSLMTPQIGSLGQYILISKILLGIGEIYESHLFLQQFHKANKKRLILAFLKEQTGGGSDYSKERAFARSNSENVLTQIQTYNDKVIGNDEVIQVLQSSAKKTLKKKITVIAVNCIRLIALFFLQNVFLANALLFICKLSKPAIDRYYTRPLQTISFSA